MVGGKPSQNIGKVQAKAKGKGRDAAAARFYLNVLRPINKRGAKKRR
jgi:hypothetical protein